MTYGANFAEIVSDGNGGKLVRQVLGVAPPPPTGLVVLSPVPQQSAKLRYSPPPQSNPTVVTVPQGFYSQAFGDNEDVILNFSKTVVRSSTMQTTGGRHIRCIGGSVHNTSSGGSTMVFKNPTGSVFLEGLLMDNSSFQGDAFNVYGNVSPGPFTRQAPDVYIQNCRVVNLNGTNAGTHTDLWQAQGSISNVYIDKLTFDSNYQGISIFQKQNPTGPVFISRVNGSYNAIAGDAFTFLFWDMSNIDSPPYSPVYLDQVYFAPRAGQQLDHVAWPPPGTTDAAGNAIGFLSDDGGASVYWPDITNIYGRVFTGAPPAGDFVPAAGVGLNYVSPGYL